MQRGTISRGDADRPWSQLQDLRARESQSDDNGYTQDGRCDLDRRVSETDRRISGAGRGGNDGGWNGGYDGQFDNQLRQLRDRIEQGVRSGRLTGVITGRSLHVTLAREGDESDRRPPPLEARKRLMRRGF